MEQRPGRAGAALRSGPAGRQCSLLNSSSRRSAHQLGQCSAAGFRFDRHWVITDAAGKFISQREMALLALVEVAITPPEVLTTETPNLAGAELVLGAPGMPELRVFLGTAGKPLVPVSVWDWHGEGLDEGEAAAAWLTKLLGAPARLVRYAGQTGASINPGGDLTRREVDLMWAPSATETAFADGFPFLLASEASMEDLNKFLPSPIPVNRFRPNILVAGEELAPWEEDSWQWLEIGGAGGVMLDLIKPCSRCQVPTIAQETGVRSPDNEPTETLHRLRSGKVLGWENPKPFKHSVFFAWNAMAVAKDGGSALAWGGVVTLGDEVRVVRRREGPPGPRQQG